MDRKQSLLIVLNDLFFRVKIEGPARQAGWTVEIAATRDEALAKATAQPALIIIDLNATGLAALDLIRLLKANEQTREIPLVAFVSHVEVELRRQAVAAGCERVLARSVMAEQLPKLLSATL